MQINLFLKQKRFDGTMQSVVVISVCLLYVTVTVQSVTVTLTPAKQTVEIGSPASFTCRYDLQGRPLSQVLWYFKYSPGLSSTYIWSISSNGRGQAQIGYTGGRVEMMNTDKISSSAGIRLPSVEVRDEGFYSCTVWYSGTSPPYRISSEVKLTVSGKYQFPRVFQITETTGYGNQARYVCYQIYVSYRIWM